MVHWCLSLNFNMWHRHPCFTWIDVNWVSMYHMHMHCVLIWCLQLLTELPLFNFPYLVHVVFFQKRGRCKGSIPLSSVKAVEFVDDTAFDQNKKFCFCFQVCTPFSFCICKPYGNLLSYSCHQFLGISWVSKLNFFEATQNPTLS